MSLTFNLRLAFSVAEPETLGSEDLSMPPEFETSDEGGMSFEL